MKFIDATQLHQLLDYPALLDNLERAHQQDFEVMERMLLEQPAPNNQTVKNHFLLWPAWQREQALGIKLITSFPANSASASQLPTVQGLYLLFDGQNGQPIACLDGVALTLRKTAADSALGTRFLARKDARILLMVGAGELAPHLIAAHCVAQPSLQHILLWNRSRTRAEQLAASLTASVMPASVVQIEICNTLEQGVRAADIISCATAATKPLIKGQWLKSGVHLDLVGGFTPTMRETDDEAIQRAELYVDSRQFTLHECGDLSQPLAVGLIDAQAIKADLFELCRGERPGRQSDSAITLFKNGGGAHLDLMVARYALAALQEV